MSENENIETSLKAMQTAIQGLATSSDVKSIRESQDKMNARLSDLEQKSVRPASFGSFTIKTLADQIHDCKSFQDMVAAERGTAKMVVKFDTRAEETGDRTVYASTAAPKGVIAPYRKPGIVEQALQPLTIEDLFTPIILTNTDSFQYTRETTSEMNVDWVGEGEAYQKSKVGFESLDGKLRRIGHAMDVDRDLMHDMQGLESFITNKMLHALDLKVENQLLLGTGVNQTIKGILTEGNYLAHGAVKSDFGSTPDLIDLIRFAATKAGDEEGDPNFIILNKMDWFKLTTIKDKNGQPIFPVARDQQVAFIDGIPVVKSKSVPKGKFLAIDTLQYGTLYKSNELILEFSYENKDNVEKNKVTVVAARRLGLAIERPFMACGGDLILPTA